MKVQRKDTQINEGDMRRCNRHCGRNMGVPDHSDAIIRKKRRIKTIDQKYRGTKIYLPR